MLPFFGELPGLPSTRKCFFDRLSISAKYSNLGFLKYPRGDSCCVMKSDKPQQAGRRKRMECLLLDSTRGVT